MARKMVEFFGDERLIREGLANEDRGQVGAALARIRDHKDYVKFYGHATFAAYYREQWHLTPALVEECLAAGDGHGEPTDEPAAATGPQVASEMPPAETTGPETPPAAAGAGSQAVRLLVLDIIVDDQVQLQARKLHVDKVEEYTEALEGGATFPAVEVYRDQAGRLWLADGFHRLAAHKALGLAEISALVVPGERRDARLHAATANARHGLAMCQAEKREAGERLIQETDWSNVEIARRLGVNETTIRRWREVLSSANAEDRPTATRTVTRGGTIYTVNTERIGAAQKQAAVALKAFEAAQREADEKRRQAQERAAAELRARRIPMQANGHRAPDLVMEDEPAVEDLVATSEPERVLDVVAEPLPLSERPDYDGDEWNTPRDIIELARRVLGHIDLDPATNRAAQEVIQADLFYTKREDGLTWPWHGRVWLNPPYSDPSPFTDKLIEAYETGQVDAALCLLNNVTDTGWMHRLLTRFPACFCCGRIPFWLPGVVATAPRQGQVLFYLGPDVAEFRRVFAPRGTIVAVLP